MRKIAFALAGIVFVSALFVATAHDLQAWGRCLEHKSYQDCYYEISQGKWYR